MPQRFMYRPNMLLPRPALHPNQPEERAWSTLSDEQRQGLDPLDEVATSASDEQAVRDLRYTLEKSGAFELAFDDKRDYDDGKTDEERLQKWTVPAHKFRPTAAPFYPSSMVNATVSPPRQFPGWTLLQAKARAQKVAAMAPRVVHELPPRPPRGYRAGKSRLSRVMNMSDIPERPQFEAKATLGQYIIMKRPKRKSQEAEEAKMDSGAEDVE